MSSKNVSTKITKSERINLRCTKAFKAQLEELCTKKGVKLTEYIIHLCAQEIAKEMPKPKSIGVKGAAKPRYTWITPQGEFDSRTKAVEASGIKADSLTKKCDDPDIDGFSRIKI